MKQFSLGKDFLFGCATASYQVEGAVEEDGRTPSIWDDFCKVDGKIIDQKTGDIACDQYHLYKDDVQLIKKIGLKSYRFSISWSRVFPTIDCKVNEKGINYYVRLCEELLANGIEPCVTLYHWDLPSYLQNIGGWENREIVNYFEKFAGVCFSYLSKYVDKWITINEPLCVSFLGNYFGEHAPGNKDLTKTLKVVHHLNLAHGIVVQLFRKMKYPGQIGITINPEYPRPASVSEEDYKASILYRNMTTDIFLYPIFKGYYPPQLKEIGFEFPVVDGDLETINQKIDFVGINYYTEQVVSYDPSSEFMGVKLENSWQDVTDMGWTIVPHGLLKLLHYFDEVSSGLPIYITENGSAEKDILENGRIHDKNRIDYLQQHLMVCKQAIDEGVNLKGYFIWSLIDNFEWAFGYTKRFGIVYVDYETQKRYMKDSAYFVRDVTAGNWYNNL